ncbi:MAG: hypothetical protein HY332_13965 [Chloroflexi bacterium]|nr:hypothetical protein [Chloroflexota bacterium]
MGTWALILLVFGALVLGFIAQFSGTPRYSYDWLITAIAAGIGGFIASEYLGPLSTWGPEFDGMFVFPALIGAIVVGAIAEVVARTVPVGETTRTA